jgi:hypothetical protein
VDLGRVLSNLIESKEYVANAKRQRAILDESEERDSDALRLLANEIKLTRDAYEEEQHPRGEHGRWESSGSEHKSYMEGTHHLMAAAIDNASFEEAASTLDRNHIQALVNAHGDLKYHYETGIVPEVKGSLPSVRLAAQQKFLTAFHGTTKEVFEAAKKEGLKPQGSKGSDEWAKQHDLRAANMFTIGDRKLSVYMAAEPSSAASFAKIAATVRKQTPTILELHIPKEFVKNAVPDIRGPIDEYGASFLRYKGVIKPEWIVRELPFHEYNSGGMEIASRSISGEERTIASHDSANALTIYAVVFNTLPEEDK